MATISYKPLKSYQVQGTAGQLVLIEASTWNGLLELRDQQGRKLIVMLPGGLKGALADAFATIGIPDEGCHMHIVAGAPDLLADLGVLKGKHDNQAPDADSSGPWSPEGWWTRRRGR